MRQIGFAVFVAHGPRRHPKRSVIERSDQRIDLGPQRRLRRLLGKTPEFAPAGDRPLIVEEHAMGVASLAAAQGNWDDLAAEAPESAPDATPEDPVAPGLQPALAADAPSHGQLENAWEPI